MSDSLTLIIAVIGVASAAVGGTGLWSYLQVRKIRSGGVSDSPAEIVFAAQDTLVKNLASQLARTQDEVATMLPRVLEAVELKGEVSLIKQQLTACEDFRTKIIAERQAQGLSV